MPAATPFPPIGCPRRLCADDPRRRLRPRRQAGRDRRRRAHRDRRHQAQEDEEPLRPAHQRRMARELARHRRREAARRRLHELPYARAHRALGASGRGVGADHSAHAALCPEHHSGGAADAQRRIDRAPGAAARAAAAARRISRERQPERFGYLPLRLQDAQARERPRHPRHHHDLRAAAADRPAPRRDGRSGRRRLLHLFRRSPARPARSEDRRGHVLSGADPQGECRQGHAEPRPRQRRQLLDLADVPGGRREVRQGDEVVHHAAGVGGV